ncbi:hypothetical protein BDA99DRAFT_532702 [Phascolomyces articulosus]|uniref:Uncharacterized protein n=1 Tax=Phascolomyces articulosus TaxID=60185 RepID=A0AAD5PJ36_9FUNG|nr:hypothetical protein BDA99DRAFT_532702 [Phascolomyces articulosus]
MDLSEELQQVDTLYTPDFKFNYLESLDLYSSPMIQKLLLEAIHDTVTLKSIKGITLYDAKGFYDFLSSNDTILQTLGDIKTIYRVSLRDLKSVSTEGINNLIRKTIVQWMEISRRLKVHSHCNNLATIEMDGLQRATGQGINSLFENT